MSLKGSVIAVRDYTPTVVEIFYWAILTFAGILIVLEPDSIFIVQGIESSPLFDQSALVGAFLIIGSPLWLLSTRFVVWVKDRS